MSAEDTRKVAELLKDQRFGFLTTTTPEGKLTHDIGSVPCDLPAAAHLPHRPGRVAVCLSFRLSVLGERVSLLIR